MKHIRALLTLLATAAFFVAPIITSPFSGFSEDQLPIPQIDPPVQPAGYAFSIWGLIYAWLAVSAVVGLWKRADDPAWDRVRLPLMISLAIGAPWLAIANASAIWATVTIFIMAAAAIAALLVTPSRDRWLLQAPVAIYAGWLTAASFVSLGSTAAGFGVLFGSLGWAYAGIAGALAVALAVQSRIPRAPEYGATVIWALVGIIVANGTVTPGVTLMAAVGIAVIAGVIMLIRRRPDAMA
jgi:hypothetical protein